MGVIIDTSGQIYNKLNAANASLSALLADAAVQQAMGASLASQIGNVQSTLASVLAEIEQIAEAETVGLHTIEAILAVMAPQLDTIYQLLIKSPTTIGVDIAGVVTAKQTPPSSHGP